VAGIRRLTQVNATWLRPFGRRIAARGIRARYVRITSNGNTSDPYNHYTEVEVYGK